MRRKRFIYNNDGTNILGNGLHDGRTITPEDVEDYVDLVAGTGVTSFFICTHSSMPYYESLHERTFGCLNPDTPLGDGGHPHKADNCERYGQNVLALLEQGTDIVQLCIDRAHLKGMEAFASMRMNDLHFNDPAIRFPRGQGDFWLAHPEYYIGKDEPGWHADGAFNFAHAEVREYKLTMVREICERFDVEGIELDFMRFPIYFPSGEGEKHLPVMTDFLRATRTITHEVGKRRGRPLELGVRLPAQVAQCRKLGFDPVVYAKERLVDFITITPFLHNFASVPVRPFRAELGDVSLPIYAGTMSHEIGGPLSHGAFGASAANCFREGADGLVLFNFFYGHENPEPIGRSCFGACRLLLYELGDADRLQGRDKVYSAGVREVAYGTYLDYALPASLSSGESVRVDMDLSEEISREVPKRAVLFVRVQGSGDWRATWNGDPVARAVCTEAHSAYGLARNIEKDATVQVFELSPDRLIYGKNMLTIQAPDEMGGEVLRADVAVEYGDPETHGYF
jgi:hypothetical protein